MGALVKSLDAGSRAVAWTVGGTTVALAVAVAATSMSAGEIVSWGQQVFGTAFLVLMAALVATSLFCWGHMLQSPGERVWLEAGTQAAGGVATLALTYTLLGVSLGVGSLAEQELTTETVPVIIQGLTGQFKTAFMTTVVGLPVATVLRTLLMVTHAKQAG